MRSLVQTPARQAVLIGAVSSALLMLWQAMLVQFRSDQLFDGYRFQEWSGDTFMQSVAINDLLAVGPIGLWYLHVQPPMLDGMRFLLALPEWIGGSNIATQTIDQRQYVIYALLYGVMNAFVFAWLQTLTGSSRWSIAGAVVWAVYPGNLAMATLLDGTYLSAALITIMLFLLYLAIATRRVLFLNLWLLALLLTTLTRTIFQLQILVFIPLIVWSLYRYRISARSGVAIAMSVVLVGSLFLLPAKQFALYDTTATTSFAGNHQIEVVSYRPSQEELDAVDVPPEILANAERFVSGFNSPENVALNYTLTQVGNAYYLSDPFQVAKNLLWGIQMNTAQAFKFTSEYAPNRFVESLPWNPPRVNGISVTFYLIGLALIVFSYLYAFGVRGVVTRVRRYWPLAFVFSAIMLTIMLANRYDWSEADRLKSMLLPTVIVILIFGLWSAWRRRSASAHSRPALEVARQ